MPRKVAGKGGDAVLRITSQHHGKNIDSVTVYIKYNQLDMADVYDDSAKVGIVDDQPLTIFSNLSVGNYYLFGFGWDPAIVGHVEGGIPFTITEDKIYSINLPVTEGD